MSNNPLASIKRPGLQLPHAPNPRYDPDLDRLRDARTGAFAWVYRTEGGRWRARIMNSVPLGRYATDVDAARAVLVWLRDWYGDKWHEVFRARKANPWRIRQAVRGGRVGWVADVYYKNCPVRVTRATQLPGQSPPVRPAGVSAAAWAAMKDSDVWASRAEAVAAVRLLIRHEVERQLGRVRRSYSLMFFWRWCDRRPGSTTSLAA